MGLASPESASSLTSSGPLSRWRDRGARLADELHGLCASFGQIYFMPSAVGGLLLFGLLMLADMPSAWAGLAGAVMATLTAVGLGFPADARRAGLFSYNGTLTGIALGTLWQTDLWLYAWLFACVVATVLLTRLMARLGWAALTGPFVAVMSVTHCLRGTLHLVPRALGAGCTSHSVGFAFCSVGQVVFIAPLVLGLLTWYVLHLWHARVTAWALAGGVVCGLAVATFGSAWPALAAQAGGIGVNGFLAALGLGIFRRNVPTRLTGAAVAAFLCVVFGQFGWPYFTLPFNLAVWTLLTVTSPAAD
ncbi:Urea transporter [Pandoraea terrae]|uniref:Urea transporter n=1 Tax=Pandoraea terrae TaxID=1537710 RepID=A0A5E4VPN8_9BURK|nr:urea transporter [Pandoraea terrae]VVE12975.1 Urea transporter [Pandoraea terrae]